MLDVKSQYKDSCNLSSRIQLHEKFSVNSEKWFPWVFKHLEFTECTDILELGCGNGVVWKENNGKILSGKNIILSDFSSGMIEDAKQNVKGVYDFLFEVINAEKINKSDASIDMVIANHMLYHMKNLETCLTEIVRILKPGKRLYATTIGESHLVEISNIVKEFDSSINLKFSGHAKKFGINNGMLILKKYFTNVTFNRYEDYLFVTDVDSLVGFIMSTSSNVREKIKGENLNAFKSYLEQKIEKDGGIKITKDIGMFIAEKSV